MENSSLCADEEERGDDEDERLVELSKGAEGRFFGSNDGSTTSEAP